MSLIIALAFGAMLCWGVGDFLIQRTERRIGPLETLAWITWFSSIALLPFVWQSLGTLNGWQIIYLVVIGFLVFIEGLIQFESYQEGKLSVVEIIITLELPLTIFLGVVFLHDILSTVQVILAASLFLGILFVAVDFRKINQHHFLEKGAVLALLSAILLAMTNFVTTIGAKDTSPLLAIWLPWTVCGLICLAYLIIKKKLPIFIKTGRHFWPLILSTSLVDTVAWICFVLAVVDGELSVVIAITESFVAVALVMGVIFNREKIRWLQYFGAALALICSILIALLS